MRQQEKTELVDRILSGTNSKDLQGADLSYTKLQGAYLEGANLLGADLEKANPQWANLLGANVTDTILDI